MKKKNPIALTVSLSFMGMIVFSTQTACRHDTEDNDTIVTATLSNVTAVGYTYHQNGGNRYVLGKGNLDTLTPINIQLDSEIKWVAAAASDGQHSFWVAVLADGNVHSYRVDDEGFKEKSILPSTLNYPIPPTLVVEQHTELKLGNLLDSASIYTNTVVLNANGDRAFIARNGDIILQKAGKISRLEINTLPYSKILVDESERLLVLTTPSSEYGHTGVLGYRHAHAKTISLIETKSEFSVLKTITLPDEDVVEGNALIWTDVDGDGTREIISTLSRNIESARLVVLNEDGTVKSESPPINIADRWRHQIAIAPFVDNDQMNLLSVHIPHLNPEIESFRIDDGSMMEHRYFSSYSSHFTGGLNLDMAMSGDFDGDDKIELLLIERGNLDEIAAFEFRDGEIQQDWTFNLSNSMTSNAAAVTLPNNQIAYGVGQGDVLSIWHP